MTEKEKRTKYWHKRYMDKMHKIHSRQIEARKQHFVNGGTLVDFVPKFSADDEELLDSILDWIINNKRWCDIVDFFAPCQLYNSDLCQRAYLKCHDLIPMEQLYELTFCVYAEAGFGFPVDIIEEMKELKPQTLANQLSMKFKNEVITVYRVSQTPPSNIGLVSDEVSWSTSPEIVLNAYLFRTRTWGSPCYLYQANLSTEDIIAYIPSMDEVIQHGECYSIRPLAIKRLIELCEAEDQRRHTGEVENHPLIDVLYAQNIG